MIEKIETLVAENAELVRSVVASGSEISGVFVGIIFVIIFLLLNFLYFLRPDRKERTFKQGIKDYSLFVTSFTGSYVLIVYSLVLIAVYTPVRYIIGYYALRYLYLI